MDLRKCFLTNNNCYKAGVRINVKGVMWHSTGANNPSLKRYVQPNDGLLGENPNNNDWNQEKPDGRSVCVHAFIGKDANGKVCTYQTLPWDYRGWHCGGSGNGKYIGFEICEDGLDDSDYFNAVYNEAVELTAYLCKEYGINPNSDNTIICHQDGYKLGIASDHSDVYHWFSKFGKTMEDVRKDVSKIMGISVDIKPEVKPSEPTTNYNGNSVVDYLNSIGQDSSYENRKNLAAQYGISNYKGTAEQNIELLNKLRNGASSSNQVSTYTGNSIVDYLNSIGKDSSFSARKQYAAQYGIVNYSGTAEQNTTLLNMMRGVSAVTEESADSYYPAFSTNSIVDGLKSIGVDSSFSSRSKIAAKNGISNYKGTAEQNNKLCNLGKSGKLKKA